MPWAPPSHRLSLSPSLSPSHTLQGQMWPSTHSVFDKHCFSLLTLLFVHSGCPGSLTFQAFIGDCSNGCSKSITGLKREADFNHNLRLITICKGRLYLDGGPGGQAGWCNFEWCCSEAKGQLWKKDGNFHWVDDNILRCVHGLALLSVSNSQLHKSECKCRRRQL